MQVVTPKLSVKARQGPSPEGFVHKSSRVEGFRLHPLFVHWNNGQIGDVYRVEGGELSVINMMKGIASLFQVIHNIHHSCNNFPPKLKPLSFSKLAMHQNAVMKADLSGISIFQ